MSGMEFARFITECVERSNGPENNIQFSTPDKHSSVAKKPLKNDKVNKVLANYKSKEYKEAIELMETMGKPQSNLANNLKTNQENQRRLLETLAGEEMIENREASEGITMSLLKKEITRIKSDLEINRNNKEK
ncbi:hypothetical protein Glove_19g394 [Diversispora epigaea]|uniref:Uncharacterized protein n=1 Tax=Diversispora epigaea TaxID=1348612 RepID=A0A397JST9_9GLOM|nr:hypothetical protein Glove_19g394 [Diversispora epigaea]